MVYSTTDFYAICNAATKKTAVQTMHTLSKLIGIELELHNDLEWRLTLQHDPSRSTLDRLHKSNITNGSTYEHTLGEKPVTTHYLSAVRSDDEIRKWTQQSFPDLKDRMDIVFGFPLDNVLMDVNSDQDRSTLQFREWELFDRVLGVSHVNACMATCGYVREPRDRWTTCAEGKQFHLQTFEDVDLITAMDTTLKLSNQIARTGTSKTVSQLSKLWQIGVVDKILRLPKMCLDNESWGAIKCIDGVVAVQLERGYYVISIE